MIKSIKNNIFMLKYLWKYKKSYIILRLLVESFMPAISEALNVILYKFIFDLVLQNGSVSVICILILILGCFKILTSILNSYINDLSTPKVSAELSKILNNEIINKAISIDLQCYDENEFYDKYTSALQEVDQRVMNILVNFLNFAKNVLTIISLVSVISILDPILFIFVFISCVLRIFIFPKQYKINYSFRMEKVPVDRKLSFFRNIFFNRNYAKDIRCIQNLCGVLSNKFHKSVEESIQKSTQVGKKILKLNIILSVTDLFMTFIIPYGYLAISTLFKRITIGSFSSLYSGMAMLSYAASDIVGNINNLNMHSLYVDNLKFLLNYKPKIEVESCDLIDCNQIDTIEFKNVSFSYLQDNNFVLKDISFKINQGEKIAIIGHNGAGKSTLIKLLLRLYDVTNGQIYINNIEIQGYTVHSLRNRMFVLLQDYNAFPITIIENIIFKNEYSTDEKEMVIDSLKKVGLDNKIKLFSHGYESNVTKEFDQDGVLFSGGELQKLAIARLFVDINSDVYIFDEPSSALDPISENEFYANMFEKVKNKFTFLITHRLSCLHMMDKILFIEKGVLIGNGTFDELLKNNHEFYDYYHMQAKNYTHIN